MLLTAVQRKLKTPEYKDIDLRHRKAMVYFNTTQTAVTDLEKYHAALDKALLRYHGLKLAEINKIIRELWVSERRSDVLPFACILLQNTNLFRIPDTDV